MECGSLRNWVFPRILLLLHMPEHSGGSTRPTRVSQTWVLLRGHDLRLLCPWQSAVSANGWKHRGNQIDDPRVLLIYDLGGLVYFASDSSAFRHCFLLCLDDFADHRRHQWNWSVYTLGWTREVHFHVMHRSKQRSLFRTSVGLVRNIIHFRQHFR